MLSDEIKEFVTAAWLAQVARSLKHRRAKTA
jgi:hypothetical protein